MQQGEDSRAPGADLERAILGSKRQDRRHRDLQAAPHSSAARAHRMGRDFRAAKDWRRYETSLHREYARRYRQTDTSGDNPHTFAAPPNPGSACAPGHFLRKQVRNAEYRTDRSGYALAQLWG